MRRNPNSDGKPVGRDNASVCQRSVDSHALPREAGAALIVALVLMLVLTVLAVSGMNMATLELNMAGNSQAQQQAFQAAETGIDLALAKSKFTTVAPTTDSQSDPDLGTSVAATMTFQGTTAVPDVAFSMGTTSSGVRAFHFAIQATGKGPRGAEARHTQGFYVVGPGGG